MPKVDVGGISLHYLTVGRGPDLVMLHGFLGNLAMGALFGVLFLRWGRRTWPFVVAHVLLDVGAGIGFILFRDRLPGF